MESLKLFSRFDISTSFVVDSWIVRMFILTSYIMNIMVCFLHFFLFPPPPPPPPFFLLVCISSEIHDCVLLYSWFDVIICPYSHLSGECLIPVLFLFSLSFFLIVEENTLVYWPVYLVMPRLWWRGASWLVPHWLCKCMLMSLSLKTKTNTSFKSTSAKCDFFFYNLFAELKQPSI